YVISFPFRIVRSVSQAEDCNVARTAKRREQCLVGDEGAGNCYVPPVKYKLRGFESSAKCWQEAVGIDVERRVHLCRRGAHRARAEENHPEKAFRISKVVAERDSTGGAGVYLQ